LDIGWLVVGRARSGFAGRAAWTSAAFPTTTGCVLLIREAQKPVQALCMAIHYLSCDGVGRPEQVKELARTSRSPAVWTAVRPRLRGTSPSWNRQCLKAAPGFGRTPFKSSFQRLLAQCPL